MSEAFISASSGFSSLARLLIPVCRGGGREGFDIGRANYSRPTREDQERAM